MLRTLIFSIYNDDLIMGKAGVPPAAVCQSPLLQAGRLLYPLFRSLLCNMSSCLLSLNKKNRLVQVLAGQPSREYYYGEIKV